MKAGVKGSEIYGWQVARLGLQLDAKNTNLHLTVPPSHLKFFQPAVEVQAGLVAASGVTFENDAALILYLRSQPYDRNAHPLVYASATWEFRKTADGRMIFDAPYQDPPRRIVVAADFSRGEVEGDFSRFAGTSFYPIQDLEIRLFTAWLAGFGDIILHASGMMKDNKGYCFAGESGAGKSTLAAALAKDPSITILGEDHVVLRYLNQRFWIFGTPWHLDPAMCSPRGAPLEKLFLLDRSLAPGTAKVTPGQGVTRLLQTAFIPYYLPENLPAILDRLALLTEYVPIHSYSFQLGADAWQEINDA